MIKITLKIDGMMCGMCEAHINDTVRKSVPQARKIASSHKKGECTFIIDGDLDRKKLEEAIAATGYQLNEVISEPYEKRGLFSWQR